MYGNNQEGYDAFYESDMAAQVAAATPHQLVLMLFTGLSDELVRAKSHIQASRYERKANSINKCIDILNALTSALDYDKGGELARNMANIYDYCVHRLYEASNNLSVEMVEEVEILLGELRTGWEGMGKLNG
ncbi:flagellar export chaperone FliS [Enterobacteriaceae bacterium RIT714]|nr:flagellar export chaperone FliS [Enterobacteriaceae bacterium RIT714]